MDDNQLTTAQIKELLQGISIPPQPQIMVDLQMEQMDDNCSIDSITRLIMQDIGLCGSILKTINSPFFGLSDKITSVHQAISLLGIATVVNLVNSLSIRSSLSDDKIIKMTRFWDSAMDVAVVSAAISKDIGLASPDEAYLFGLFHNCGNMLMLSRFETFPSVVVESYAIEERRIVDVENEVFNTNHCVVGYYVSKAWNLPNYISEAIQDHHSVDDIFANTNYKNSRKKNLLAILKMAENICETYQTLGEQTSDYEWSRLEASVLDHVGLSTYDYTTLKENIEDQSITSGFSSMD
ncbi:MAG: HDOD domain-containing protein [Pseudomonadales bacterium]|nr:HDOD domain-containing protein [Pseudomonadales bacterium]